MCDCRLCKRSREVRAALERIPEQEREFWSRLHEGLFETEADLEYYKAIVDGTWPNADEVIANHRKKHEPQSPV